MKKLPLILILFATLLSGFPSLSFAFFPENTGHPKSAFESIRFGEFHNDSLHRIDFRYADRKRGIKPFIVPAVLIAGGTVFNYSDLKYDAQEWVWKNHNYQGSADDYLRFGPVVGLYALNALGVKAQNNIGNQSAILFKSLLLNTVITKSLKNIFDEKRPTGDPGSFPSGHTSLVFAAAQVIHHEYGENSVWYSIGAYSCATAVGAMRFAKGGHWFPDVLAGAGIGMISTELVYLTHQYKWDWQHMKRLDIFPFSIGRQKGLTLVYTF